METRLPKLCASVLAAVLVCCTGLGAYAAENPPTLQVSPRKIGIGLFYHGADIAIEGLAPPASEVAVVILGRQQEHTLSLKGRVALLWMNVDTVSIGGAPELYFLLTSSGKFFEKLPSETARDHLLGYDALRESIAIEPEGSDRDLIFREFIKFKESLGLYKRLEGSVQLSRVDKDFCGFSASCAIPPRAPEGEYRVLAYSFNEGDMVSNSSAALTVEKVGVPEKISMLAFEHAALYGAFAIAVAVCAGLLMGLIFGSRAKGGH